MDLRKYIDYTNLKPDASEKDIIKLCKLAKENNLYSVCVNSGFIETARKELENSDVKISSVIGFPLGASISEVKAFEAEKAVEKGADELDMVINISALKDGRYDYVKSDIEAVKRSAKGRTLKVIIETCLLTDEEKVKACEIAKEAGADFVKTSTGFNGGGAEIEDVKLMRKTVGENMGVKASGGIRSAEDAEKFIEAGASRIGTSSILVE